MGMFSTQLYRPQQLYYPEQILGNFLPNLFDFEMHRNPLVEMVSFNTEKTSKLFCLPGVKPEDVKINIDDKTNSVSIRARKATEIDSDGIQSSSSSTFAYQFVIPNNVDMESINANFEDGKLKIFWKKLDAIETTTHRPVETCIPIAL